LTNKSIYSIIYTEKKREIKKMKKTTKNINANYNLGTGKWYIRDNGEVLAEGTGLIAYEVAIETTKATATKKIVEKIVY
jgi:hypothetical protein